MTGPIGGLLRKICRNCKQFSPWGKTFFRQRARGIPANLGCILIGQSFLVAKGEPKENRKEKKKESTLLEERARKFLVPNANKPNKTTKKKKKSKQIIKKMTPLKK